MANLRRYTSFKALKSAEKAGNTANRKDDIFSEFASFLKRLQTEYYNKQKSKTGNGKQLSR